MKPLFTIHAGEYLVGSHIERHFKRVKIWVPSRDTGVDLLVTDNRKRHAVSLQVKFSRDYRDTRKGFELQKRIRAIGWWKIDRDKLRTSIADFWVLVLQGFANRTTDFIIVPPRELLRRLHSIHGSKKTIHSYLWVTESRQCWETRGLQRGDERRIADRKFQNPDRAFTKWLNNWSPVAKLNR